MAIGQRRGSQPRALRPSTHMPWAPRLCSTPGRSQGARGGFPTSPPLLKGYGHSRHTVLGTQGFDDLRGPGIRPLAAFLLLVAHGDLDTSEHFGGEDGSDAAQAERRGKEGQLGAGHVAARPGAQQGMLRERGQPQKGAQTPVPRGRRTQCQSLCQLRGLEPAPAPGLPVAAVTGGAWRSLQAPGARLESGGGQPAEPRLPDTHQAPDTAPRVQRSTRREGHRWRRCLPPKL